MRKIRYKLNRKGFTLIELLMTIILLAIIIAVASPIALNALEGGKQKSYDILVDNILTASKSFYEEVKYVGINKPNTTDSICSTVENDVCKIEGDSYIIQLQTLVDYGFLTTDVECDEENDTNKVCQTKVIKNPKDKVNIGTCQIKITIDSNTKVSYNVVSLTNSGSCPINDDTGMLGSVS